MTCHSRWMSPGLGLYVRNVVGLLLVRVRPGLIPGTVVELRLLTNTARCSVWIDRLRVCGGPQRRDPAAAGDATLEITGAGRPASKRPGGQAQHARASR